MPKRNRTKSRLEDMYSLAVASHTNNWRHERTAGELEVLLAKNTDLLDEKARNVARDEFWDMADSALRGALPRIRQLTEQLMKLEPPGTKKRFQHEFLKICRKARKQGLHVAIRNVEERLRK
jgi:hypothetical protein